MQKIGFIAFFSAFLSQISYVEASQQDDVWLDTMHKSISESVMDSAQWFDDFFANENVSEDQQAKGEVRLRLGWEPRSRELDEFEARLRIRVKLPKLKNRVDLILSDSEEDIDNKIRAGRQEDINRQDDLNIALRYKVSPDSGLSHRVGLGRRFQYFAKSRYRDKLDLTDNLEMRYDASVYYYNRDKFGADTGLGFAYEQSSKTLLRFENRFYYRDKTEDWLWQHNWQVLHQLNENSAVIVGYFIEGLSRPNYRLEEYLLSVKLRRNTVREWLYYDIEPFILWRRDEGFSASYGIALRLEGFFGER